MKLKAYLYTELDIELDLYELPFILYGFLNSRLYAQKQHFITSIQMYGIVEKNFMLWN